MNKIYSNVTEELPGVFTDNITEDNVSYHLGLNELKFKEAIVSDAMIISTPHSVVLIRANDIDDAKSLKEEIKANINPNKWICVGVDKENAIIFIIMNNERTLIFTGKADENGILNEEVDNIQYIDLFNILELEDYYKTDHHWRQEKILKVANTLGKHMDFTVNKKEFKEKEYEAFKGVYSEYIENPKEEKLIYLTNELLDNAKVEVYGQEVRIGVYKVESFLFKI